MNYGDLIRDAFSITWRNKFLWFFGFFAGGTSSGFNVPSVPSGGDLDDFDPGGGSEFSSALVAQGGQGVFENAAFLVALGVLVLVVVLVFIVLGLVSQGALAESVAAIDRGEQRRFSSAFRAGWSNFWRVLGYYAVFILISLALLVVIGVPIGLIVWAVVSSGDPGAGLILAVVVVGLLALLLLIVVFVPLWIVGQLALRELVIGRAGVLSSVSGGARIFWDNLGRSLIVGLIVIALGLAAALALVIALLIVGLLLALPAIALAVADLTTAAIVAAVVAALILVPLLVVVSGAIGAFNHTYWTLAYLRLTGRASGVASPR